MWIARDKDGDLWIYRNIPYKYKDQWYGGNALDELNSSLFPEVKWEDEEPTEVELVIKNKK